MVMMASNVQKIVVSSGGGGGGGGGAYATGGTVVDYLAFGTNTPSRSHIFTSSGTFVTTSNWPSGHYIEYLIVAGGGGGNSGGGGAGGILNDVAQPDASTNYAVIIGAGGGTGANGVDSSFIGGSLSFTSTGGGGGGSNSPTNGQDGGSGGGGGIQPGTGSVSTGLGGMGISGQGNNGGDAQSTKAGGGYTNNPGDGGGYGSAGLSAGGGSYGLTYGTFQIPATGTYNLQLYFLEPPTTGTTYTFTVASGLPLFTNSSVTLLQMNAGVEIYCRVVSYSGTTLELVFIGDNGIYDNNDYSNWLIVYNIAGGGSQYLARNEPNGGGGGQAVYPGNVNQSVSAAINSGGGGSPYGTGLSGGSGIVIITYIIP